MRTLYAQVYVHLCCAMTCHHAGWGSVPLAYPPHPEAGQTGSEHSVAVVSNQGDSHMVQQVLAWKLSPSITIAGSCSIPTLSENARGLPLILSNPALR